MMANNRINIKMVSLFLISQERFKILAVVYVSGTMEFKVECFVALCVFTYKQLKRKQQKFGFLLQVVYSFFTETVWKQSSQCHLGLSAFFFWARS